MLRKGNLLPIAVALISAASTLGWSGVAPAADFPTKPLRLVVPFPPGGALDIVARSLTPKLLKQLVVKQAGIRPD
jgi:tripartite-type tricarboxylate transporter receptor subunit TctC